MTRFVDIDLSRLDAPPVIRTLDYEENRAARIARLKQALNEAGIAWDVDELETDPLVIREEGAAFFDLLVKARVNDAARAVRLAYARGSDLDHIAAEMGVARNPGESDDSLRRRRQLVIEAFSVAGPEGAYYFHALNAHPQILDAGVYGPESGLCQPGEVLLVIAGKEGAGIPRAAIMDAAADYLDAREVRYADYTSRIRPIRRTQQFRPLTDKVIVSPVEDATFTIDATMRVLYGPDREVVRQAGLDRLDRYLASRRRVGMRVSDSSIAAALHVTDDSGVALVEDIDLTIGGAAPGGDVEPGPTGMARCTGIRVAVETVT